MGSRSREPNCTSRGTSENESHRFCLHVPAVPMAKQATEIFRLERVPRPGGVGALRPTCQSVFATKAHGRFRWSKPPGTVCPRLERLEFGLKNRKSAFQAPEWVDSNLPRFLLHGKGRGDIHRGRVMLSVRHERRDFLKSLAAPALPGLPSRGSNASKRPSGPSSIPSLTGLVLPWPGRRSGTGTCSARTSSI